MSDLTVWQARSPRAGQPGKREAVSNRIIALEPRFMFDAAGVAVASEGVGQHDAAPPQTDHAQPAADPAFLDALAQSVPAAAARPDTAPARAADAPVAVPAPGGSGRHEVMFVDPTVANYETLVDGARPGGEVVVLDPSRDGLVQMAEYLNGRSGIDSIQIMAHGSAGRFALGAVDVNSDTLQTHGAELAAIGRALTEGGDILIYACNTGAGIDGQGFVIDLAAATGADVAASSDNTGAAALGGNWALETRAGSIESTVALTARAQDGYDALMTATFTLLTGNANPVSAMGTVGTKTFIAADFDGDGDNDFIFRNNSASPTGVDFWRNSGGAFTKFSGAVSGNPFSSITWSGPNSTALAAGFSPFSMVATDVDGDGDIDVVNMASANGRGVWLNNSGTFTYATNSPTLPTVTANTQALPGDFDGDGDIDVILRNQTAAPSGVDFWRNDGGTFTKISGNVSANPFSAITFAASAPNFDARFMAAGDVDGDGDIDVINMTASANPGRGIWLNNNGVFSIVSAGCLPTASASGQFAAGDFDGDGDTDIAFRNASGTAIDFYRASGGTFALANSASPFSAIVFCGGANANFNYDLMTTLDIDGDGDLDIANLASSAGRGTFRNDLTPPQLTSVVVGGVTVSNADSPTDVNATPTITLNFNKSINSAGTGKITIREYGTGTLVTSVTATDTTKVSGVGSSSTITITPGVTLSAGTKYYVQIDKGAFFDSDGATLGRVDAINNATMGLTSKTLFDFTTFNTAPTLDLNGAGTGTGNTVTLAGAASGLAVATATAGDAENDSANWNGATLTVKRTATAGTTNGAWSSDGFGFTGASGITISGGDLKSGPTTIGTATNTGGTLTITFNGSATTALVTSVVKGVTYSNSTPAGNATITFALTDGSGGSTSADVSVTSSDIHVTTTTDTATVDATNGVSFSEAVAIANAQSGADTLIMGSGFTGAMSLAGSLTVSESLTLNANSASGWIVRTNPIAISSGATLTVTNSGGTMTIDSALSGAGGLIKAGAGTLTLSNSGNSYSSTTAVSAGTLLVTGALTGTTSVSVASGATLGGTGSITTSDAAGVTISSGATLAPGVAGTSNGIGKLTINGNLGLSGGLAVEVGGSGGAGGTDFDQVAVNGTVSLNGGPLSVSRVNSYAATNGTVFRVIDNDSTDAVGGSSGTFGSIAEGTNTTTNGDLYTVSYIAGTGNDVTLTSLANPTVSSVSATAADGSYKAGDTISITVTFNQSVTVTGTPTLALGNNNRTATYSSGSGGTTLTFTYTVQSGDTAGDLDYASTSALALSGGSIKDSSSGLDATLTLATPGATNSLGANKNIVIDTTAPTVSSVAVPSDRFYRAGEAMEFAVTFSEAVTVSGTPTLVMTFDNGETGTAQYVSGSGGQALTFRYTVGENRLDTNGIALAGSLNTNGGSIKDAAGNSASLTLNGVAGTGGVLVDSVIPAVKSVTSSMADGGYTTGAAITIDVTFSEAVTVSGTPTLALNSGATATYSSGSGSATLSFTYTVKAGENAADLDYSSTSALSGTIKDGAGNSAVLTLPNDGGPGSLGGSKNLVIDTSPPTILSVAVPDDGTYTLGKTLRFFIRVSEAVTVTGSPALQIQVGDVVREATFNASGSAPSILRFDYVVQAGDVDRDGIAVKELRLDGTTITDIARAPLTATLSNIADSSRVLVDTVVPAKPGVAQLAAGSDTGVSATDNVTNNAQPTITGTAEGNNLISVRVDGQVVGTARTDASGRWTYGFGTPLTGGAHAITVTSTNSFGTVSEASSPLTVTIDTSKPTVSTPTLAAGSDSGDSGSDRITNVTRPTVTGTAEAGSTVSVIVDGTTVGTVVAGSNGAWSFTPGTALSEGSHRVQAQAIDRAGNVGAVSDVATLTIDTTPPAAPGLSVSGSSSAGGQHTVHGTAEAGSAVTVFLDGVEVGQVRANGGGQWQFALAGSLATGSHTVAARPTDVAGNTGGTGSTSFTIEPAAPPVPATTPGATSTGSTSAGTSSTSSSAPTLGATTAPTLGSIGSAPSLPGGQTSSDTGRVITASSIGSGGGSGGDSTSSDAGRAITINSLGNSTSSDAGRSITFSSLGGAAGGSNSSGSGLGGPSSGGGLSGAMSGGLGGGSLGGGSLGSGGLGANGLSGGGLGAAGLVGGLGGGLGSGAPSGGPATGGGATGGPATGSLGAPGSPGGGSPGSGSPANIGAPGTGTTGLQGGRGNAPASGPLGGEREGAPPGGTPGTRTTPQGGPQKGQQGAPPSGDGQPDGSQPQGTPSGGEPASGNRADADAPAGPRAFSRQVAQVHDAAGTRSAALLAALRTHPLPGSRAA